MATWRLKRRLLLRVVGWPARRVTGSAFRVALPGRPRRQLEPRGSRQCRAGKGAGIRRRPRLSGSGPGAWAGGNRWAPRAWRVWRPPVTVGPASLRPGGAVRTPPCQAWIDYTQWTSSSSNGTDARRPLTPRRGDLPHHLLLPASRQPARARGRRTGSGSCGPARCHYLDRRPARHRLATQPSLAAALKARPARRAAGTAASAAGGAADVAGTVRARVEGNEPCGSRARLSRVRVDH